MYASQFAFDWFDKSRETWAAPLWITCGDLCYEVVMKPPKNLPQMSVVCDRVLVSQKKEGTNGQDVCLLRERVH
jgi:hypothetical protein